MKGLEREKTREPKDGVRLNERQKKFLENLFLKGMGQADSYMAAGYRSSTKQHAHEAASALLRKLETENEYRNFVGKIEEEHKVVLKAQIRASVNRLVDLRDHATKEDVRLRAAQDLLDRAGMGEIQKHAIEERRQLFLIERTVREDEGPDGGRD